MITIWPVSLKNLRVFGWVQDPSNLRSLCNVTAIFDSESSMHKELVDHLIDDLVSIEDGKERLLEALKKVH